MTEFGLIYHYFNQQRTQSTDSTTDRVQIVKAIGDDAAVLEVPQGVTMVTCVDTMVQGRHFSDDWAQVDASAFTIGYKAVAVNASDIAAMGATPHSLLLALALPQRLATDIWLSEFAKGLFHACQQFGMVLIGGDTTRSDKLVMSVTANGVMKQASKPIYRSGAQVGDKVYVSGTLGDACYALYHPETKVGRQLVHRLNMPTPRIKLGQALAEQGHATSMIDISDGLAQDLSHICQQSTVAMCINIEQLPTSQPLRQVDIDERLRCQLTGGDDYELAFTLPAHVQPPQHNTPITCIGDVVAQTDKMMQPNAIDAQCMPENVITLMYKGQPISEKHSAPFTSMPNLSGFQHFSH